MKINYFFALAVFSGSLFSQEKISYTSQGQNIEFEISNKQLYVEYNQTERTLMHSRFDDKNITDITSNTALLSLEVSFNKFINGKDNLLQEHSGFIQKVEPVLIYKDGIKQVSNKEIIINLSNSSDLEKLLNDYEYEKSEDKYVKNQFIIKLQELSTRELFELANRLNERKEVIFAEPNFIRLLRPHTNDTFYNSQWAIINQGYMGGTVDADMDVDNAWSKSTGIGVKVAIIDEGVDLTHTDLNANLLPGHDATDGNSFGAPNEITNDAHGTACAGIVAAVANNSTGIAGVAYNAEILPVRIAYSNGFPLGDIRRAWITNDTWIANGINWAVNNGADVLSNSWGGGSPSSTITNAINNAVNNGRNNNGCVVLFSTGNTNTVVSYPATLSNVIAVGATSQCDQRKTPTSCDGENWWGSNFGTEIDVVAPGVEIYTTDI